MGYKLAEADVRKAVIDAWDIAVEGVAKDKNINTGDIEGRNKIKSLVIGLREHEDPRDSVLHFVKYAEYMLPRSRFNETLSILLKKVEEIRKDSGEDHERAAERIKYTIGYLAWSLDGFCNIIKLSGSEFETRTRNMLETEMNLIGRPEKVDAYLNGLVNWKNKQDRQRR